jgi:simple sugar transport system ATP-binding protein
VFISHKLDEVLAVADRITVLRRGSVVGETTPAETSKDALAEMMVGRPVLFRLEKPDTEIGESVLQVVGLLGEGKLNGLTLEVRSGEILGVAGVEGNGQRELAEAVIGLRRPAAGHVIFAGREIGGMSVAQVRNAGVGYIPEDRHEQGLVLNMSLWENAVLGRQDDVEFSGALGVLFIKKIKELAARLVKTFDIRTRSVDVAASTLSGGNQQKLILARELETDPKLLIAAQPTRGLDVGAIEYVHRRLVEQRDAGCAVLLVSFELDEVLDLADRILVMYEGQIVLERMSGKTDERELGIAMTGGKVPA